MTKLIVLILTSIFVASPAFAQSWPGAPAETGSPSTPTNLQGTEYVATFCRVPPSFGGCHPSGSGAFIRYVSIEEFARAHDVAELRQEMLAARSAIDEATDGAALAAALDFERAAPGSANRLGALATSFGESSAVGMSYTRSFGSLDFGVGIATTGDRFMSKAGLGISW